MYRDELNISEKAWKQAVLVIKILDATDNPRKQVKAVYKTAHTFLRADHPIQRAFALHLLRFLYKSNRASLGWIAKRRILGMLRSHSSLAVRLGAFDVLGAIMTQTGSRSGVRESDYSDLMDFRRQMLQRASELEAYENSEAPVLAGRLISEGDLQNTLDRLMHEMG